MVETDDPGDLGANARLFASLYADLRRMADRELRRYPAAGVSPTTLVHEAYLNLVNRDGVTFPDQGRCMSYVARAMRGVLIDFARRHQAMKRGSGFKIVELNTQIGEQVGGELRDDKSLSRLSEALDELAVRDAKLAELVDLRYFCGYTFDEIAAQRGTSIRTVKREWEKARAYLFHQLKDAFPCADPC